MNWRLTADPEIHDHELDLAFFFDIGPEMERCMVPHDTHNYYFQDNYKSKYLQLVLSDRVPNCLMEAMERQDWFKYDIDTKFMVDHFGTHLVPINAALFRRSYPQMAEQFGDDQELLVELEFRRPRVTFGVGDNDMFFESTIRLGVKKVGELSYVLYDELDLYMEGDISIEQEVFIGNIETLRVSKAGHSD